MLPHSTPLSSGWDVYGADGAKIGTIADTSNNFFVIEKAFLHAADLVVPRSAIVAIAGERVQLKFTEAELEEGNFASPVGARSNDGWNEAGWNNVVDSMHASQRAIRRP
jgi:hypothetical protein